MKKNNLAKKIILGGLIVEGLAGCIRTYHIDGNIVKRGPFERDNITEYKGADEIKYIPYWFGDGISFDINGKRHDKNDTLIYPDAEKKYFYLLGKIDSTNAAEKNMTKQEKLERKRKEEENDLWVIRK